MSHHPRPTMNKLARNLVSGSSSLARTPKPLSRRAALVAVRHNSTDTPKPPAVAPSGQDHAAEYLKELNENSEFPDLMTPDILMDLHQSTTFAPSRHSPYQNKVVIRNDPSMFDALREQHDGAQPASERAGAGKRAGADERDETDPLQFLHLSPGQVNRLYRYPVLRRRVVQQTGKGKVARQHVVLVVGNQAGLMGVGEGKSAEPQRALRQALTEAVRNMDYVERFEDRTVWTETETKLGATRVVLRPRPVGFGLHCNPNIYHLLKAAGIKDASAKVWGSRNPLQVIKATVRLLSPGNAPLGMGNGLGGRGRRMEKGTGMRAQDDLERERGRKLVHLRT
ncbi:hypothetical protein B0H21DRAFT_825190 [Amylocystis lapponica]|nr:hypothetical protein B0H21DRAFT_825190 [Amylocystis lapponica]